MIDRLKGMIAKGCACGVLAAGVLVGARPATATLCGPDAFGYTWRDQNDGAVFVDVPFVAPTTLTQPAAGQPAQRVAFVFPFYGTTYTDVYISPQGWVSLTDPGRWDLAPACFPNAALPNAVIAPFWNSRIPSADSGLDSLQYEIFPALDVMKFYWKSHVSTTNFGVELLLFGDGRILFQYHVFTGADSEYQQYYIGIEDGVGAVGLQVRCGPTLLCPFYFAPFAGTVVEYVPPALLDCSAAQPLSCGQMFHAPSPSPPNPNVVSYGCGAALSYAGYESVFTFTLSEPSSVTATLGNIAGRDLDLFLLNDCTGFQCISRGDGVLTQPTLAAGTYYLVVDGPTVADTTGAFDITITCQSIASPIACGQTVSGDTSGGLNRVSGLSCAPSLLDGPDRMYQIVIPVRDNVEISLSSAADLDLVVLSSLDPAVCEAWGDDRVKLWGALGTYLILVDGDAGVSGAFDLTVTCGVFLDCTTPPPVSIACGELVSGDTTTGTNNVSAYSCADDPIYTGPELIYQFDNPTDQQVTIALHNATPGLELFVLDDCNEGSCLYKGLSCDKSLPAGRYYLVVDGENGVAGSFDLEVVCGPYQLLNQWRDCPERPNPPTQYSTTQAREWHFDSGLYCGTGCDFEMYVTVDCGNEFHIPFYDVESGHISIFSLYDDTYMQLTAEGTGGFSAQGQRIDWSDSGCPNEMAAGWDPMFNEQTMDISFQGNPTSCGVYRLEFYNWGGYVWDLYANCQGDARPEFMIYDNACDALAAYDPAPELILENLVLEQSGCPDLGVQVDVLNIGCLPTVPTIVALTSTTGQRQTLDAGVLGPGERRMVQFQMTLTATPASITVEVDPSVVPGDNGLAIECSERDHPVACMTQGGAQVFTEDVCLDPCPDPPVVDAGEELYTCEAFPIEIGLNLYVSGGTPPFTYHWEPAADLDDPDIANPTVLNPLVTKDYTCTVIDAGDCAGGGTVTLNVIPDAVPEVVPGPLILRKVANSVALSWPETGGPTYNVRRDLDKPFAASLKRASGLFRPTFVDPGAVFPPPKLFFYRVSASSCGGDEGPF